MKAAIRRRYVDPSGLRVEQVERPEPGQGEVRVRVHATTVNRTDCALLSASPAIMRLFVGLRAPKRPITGTDLAGTVDAVGDGVSDLAIGDTVWAFHDEGISSHAEYSVLGPRSSVERMPSGVTFVEAVASLEGAHYAYNFIKRVPLERGSRVLVNGASGAIGSAAVQMLVRDGVDVTAVCGTKNVELLRTLGATHVIDFEAEDFKALDDRFDAVLDSVGKSTFGACKHLLQTAGTYISSELGPGCQNPFLALVTPLARGRRVRFPVPTDVPATMADMRRRLEEGSFRPVIDREVPLDDVAGAFRYVVSGQKTGNVVLNIHDPS